jgi:hypothetical protein
MLDADMNDSKTGGYLIHVFSALSLPCNDSESVLFLPGCSSKIKFKLVGGALDERKYVVGPVMTSLPLCPSTNTRGNRRYLYPSTPNVKFKTMDASLDEPKDCFLSLHDFSLPPLPQIYQTP